MWELLFVGLWRQLYLQMRKHHCDLIKIIYGGNIMKNGQTRFFARTMIFVMIVGTFSSLAISLPNASAGPPYPIAIRLGEGDVGLIEYETPINDFRHDFADAPVEYFDPDGDYDNDGLTNGFERSEVYSASFHLTDSTQIPYGAGDPLFVYNAAYNFQRRIPQNKIIPIPNGAYGWVDLYDDLGFDEIDFQINNRWELTDGAIYPDYLTVYSYVSTTPVWDAEDPVLYFFFSGAYKDQTITTSGKTDPFDADTDDEGLGDGLEVNDLFTSPIDPDSDNDGTWDLFDIDPLVDLKITVEINEILEIESPDGEDNYGDYFAVIQVDGDWWVQDTPSDAGNGHTFPDIKMVKDVLDTEPVVDITIRLWDYDPDSSNEHMDIARFGRDVDISYDLRTGMWSGGDDSSADSDRNGLGHTSGFEDGYIGSDECDIWFDIYQTDSDNDRLPYWQELVDLGTDPRQGDHDTDFDGMPDWWELRYGFDRLVDDGDEDFDEDHVSNADEFSNNNPYYPGTNPVYFEPNIIVSLDWDANFDYLVKLANGIEKASNFLWDVTDGYMYFRRVEIHRNGELWDEADVRIFEGTANDRNDHHWPHVPGGGVGTYLNGPTHSHIVMPQYFDHDDWWGYDEYTGPGGDAECEPCIMDNSHGRSELCWRNNHDGDHDTRQEQINGESCWETFYETFEDHIWFDLDKDGDRDTSYFNDFEPESGPHSPVRGIYTMVSINPFPI
jgi:hypothetical protein